MKIPENFTTEQMSFIEHIFNRGVEQGKEHRVPSPETLERLEKLETTLTTMMESFKEHSRKSEERIEEIVREFKEGMKDVKRITELLGNASFMTKFFISAGAVLTFGTGTFLTIKQILHAQN